MKQEKNTYTTSNVFLKINQLLWQNSFLQKIRVVFFYIDWFLLLGIKKPKYIKQEKKKVLVVYNMALGDGVMFYGVSKALRDIYPHDKYEISIACQKAFADLYRSNDIYDNVMPFDFTSSVINLKNRRNLFKQLRNEYYDIVIDPVGCDGYTTNIFVTRAILAKEKIGILDKTLPSIEVSKRKINKIYTKIIENHKPNLHLIQFYGELFSKLGAKNVNAYPAKLPSTPIDLDLPEKFFILFPTASMDVKKWDLNNYAYLARQIQKFTNLPLLVCGTNHDKKTIDELLALIPEIQYIDVIGKTNIMQFIEVISRASLVVTNDTSAYHIAVATQRPTVMICGGYTYTRYAHYNYATSGYKDPVLANYKMDCYNCNNRCKHYGFNVFPCIEQITKEETWKKVKDLIVEEKI